MRSSENKIKTLNYSPHHANAVFGLYLKPPKKIQIFIASVKSRIQSLKTANLMMISN